MKNRLLRAIGEA